jgi:hypothetical protein
MRFEKLLWSILLLWLAGGIGWDGGSTQPLEDSEPLQALDGCSTFPPPPRCQ